MFTDFGKKPLLENWLPWQQRNVYLQFLNLEILLMPSYEKSPSFKVIACSVLEFGAIYWAGGGKHLPPVLIGLIGKIDHESIGDQVTGTDSKQQKGYGQFNTLLSFLKLNNVS